MLKLIIGKKGTGKTKQLIELVNEALVASKGNVICLEKGDKLRYDIKPQCRLIDTEAYAVNDADDLYGFVAGILAMNSDVTDLFIDSALKICKDDKDAFDIFLGRVESLSEGINIVMTSSIDTADATEVMKKYL